MSDEFRKFGSAGHRATHGVNVVPSEPLFARLKVSQPLVHGTVVGVTVGVLVTDMPPSFDLRPGGEKHFSLIGTLLPQGQFQVQLSLECGNLSGGPITAPPPIVIRSSGIGIRK